MITDLNVIAETADKYSDYQFCQPVIRNNQHLYVIQGPTSILPLLLNTVHTQRLPRTQIIR